MTEADVIQPSASIASTGKGIRYIGKDPMFAYAYSGALGASGSPGTDYFDFTTGAGVIVAKIQWFYVPAASNDVEYRTYLNEVLVVSYIVDSSTGTTSASEPDNWFPLIIPPFTRVRTNALGSQQQICNLTGRVYGED